MPYLRIFKKKFQNYENRKKMDFMKDISFLMMQRHQIKKLFLFLIYSFLTQISTLQAYTISTDNQNKKETSFILLVGGAGFIGSYINEMLYQKGYQTIILDNLSQGDIRAVKHGIFVKGDLEDKILLNDIFTTYPITAVMHFAASKAVGESIKDPIKYYNNNVTNTLNLLTVMLQHNVKNMIFSSSAAIFGVPSVEDIDEELIPNPINPYGRSKLMVEMILRDLSLAYPFSYISLRYFNVAGGDPNKKFKNYEKDSSNLIPIILKSLYTSKTCIEIFGTDYPTPDGTCIRDYIHIEDIGVAHLLALEKLIDGCTSSCYNLGSGKGFSVKEVIATVEKVTGCKINIIEGNRREGDPARVVANSYKAHYELNWQPQYVSLELIIQHAWNAMLKDEDESHTVR